jgi:hypothetical protein
MTEQAAKKAKKGLVATHMLTLDIETTGPNCMKHWMPEMGAAFWKIGDKEPISTFYRCMSSPSPTHGWSPRTLNDFWNNPAKGVDGLTPFKAYTRRRRANPEVTPTVAMNEFVAYARWIDAHLEPGEELIIVVDTAAFDTTFINVYLGSAMPEGPESLPELFGSYRAVRDITSFYFGMGGKLGFQGSESVALAAIEASKMPEWVQKYAHNHDPMSDANAIAAAASFILSKGEGE